MLSSFFGATCGCDKWVAINFVASIHWGGIFWILFAWKLLWLLKWMEGSMQKALSGIRAGLNGWSNRSYEYCDFGIMTC